MKKLLLAVFLVLMVSQTKIHSAEAEEEIDRIVYEFKRDSNAIDFIESNLFKRNILSLCNYDIYQVNPQQVYLIYYFQDFVDSEFINEIEKINKGIPIASKPISVSYC